MSGTGISRRQFLGGAAAVAAASAVPVISQVAPAAANPAVVFPTDGATANWTPLDAQVLARHGLEIYRGKYGAGQSGCSEGAYWPIIEELGARYPDTWGTIPKGLWNYGSGGVGGWGNICGGANGGSALLGQMGAPTAFKDEYFAWYEGNLFPSNAAYLDYRSGAWAPAAGWGGAGVPVPLNNAPKAKPNSLLCHSSHGNWMAAAVSWKALYGAAADTDRCSKLVYDCVYKLATLVNLWKSGGTVSGTLDPAATSAGCLDAGCHASTGSVPVRGKMKCTSCHVETLGDNHGL